MSTAKHTVTYDCGHSFLFQSPTPKLGEAVWCTKCNIDTTVKLAPDSWSTRCLDCGFNSKHGAAKISSELAAGRHRQQERYRNHRVRQYNGKRLVRTFGERDGRAEVQGELPLF